MEKVLFKKRTDMKPNQPTLAQEMEKRFVKWAEARDDVWWEEGQGHISIWDVRVMLDFVAEEQKHWEENITRISQPFIQARIKQELAHQRKELLEEIRIKILTEITPILCITHNFNYLISCSSCRASAVRSKDLKDVLTALQEMKHKK